MMPEDRPFKLYGRTNRASLKAIVVFLKTTGIERPKITRLPPPREIGPIGFFDLLFPVTEFAFADKASAVAMKLGISGMTDAPRWR